MRELIRSSWLIAAAVLIPLLLFAVFQSGFAARDERRAIEARSLAQARSVIVASDAIIARTIGGIEALSTIQALPRGDVAGAYGRARAIAALNPNWVTVELTRVRDGTILFDLRRPLGAGMLATAPRPAPADTLVGPVVRDGAGCPCVTVERAAPGPDGGYVISVLLAADPFLRLLPSRGRQYEVSALVTPDGRFIARTVDQAKRVGTLASRSVRTALASGEPSGIYRGQTLEGFENYSAFARSSLTGWSAHIAMDTRYLDTPARRFLGSIGVAALLSALLAVVLIWFALRQLAAGRRAAERGQQAQKLEALGQLTGGIAHDFNNLLTPVVGALDFLITRGSLDERGRRIANGALASAQRAGKLTAQLLAFSRRQKLEIAPVDVNLLFDELRPILEQAVGKDHAVDFAVAPDVLCVRTDYNQLELAILNLVINARDAMPGGGTIRIEAALERDVVVLRVIDEGEGMSAETRQRALEPFFTTKSTGRGTGLGLAQVFGVMEQSGGSVDIDSRVGSGTTVTLRLPLCDEVPAPRQRLSSSVTKTAKSLRLLIVDDDPAVRAAIARLFEDGHVVDSVGDARIALTAIEHCDYDLAIVDFAMPVLDGAALIRAARKLRPAQKFLMVTGYSDSEAVTAACPDTPVIRKPFDIEALRDRVRELVG
jgi:signal transduction histidine kinase/CheY-like chemotaxis protein